MSASSSSSASPLKTIESVLKLNSKGTKLLQSKRYGKAITAFSSCLTKVKEVISESQEQQEQEHDLLEDQLFTTSSDQLSLFSFSFRFLPASSSQANNSLDFLSNSNSSSLDHTDDSSSVITSISARSHASATTSDATASSSTTTTSADQDTNSFQSPILIVLDDVPGRRRRRRRRSSDQNSSSSSKTKKPMVVLSFAILYNLAIAFHLSGIHKAQTNPDQEQRRLCKALKLYQTAYNLIQEHKDDHEQNAYELVGIMETMALLNNMGQVHWLLGNHTEAGACFEEMLGSVVWVTHCGDQRTVFQFDLFFHNAMSHVLQPKQSAAAA